MSLPAPNNILTLPRPLAPAKARRATRQPRRAETSPASTLSQGLAVLAAFDAQSTGLSNAALAKRTGLSRATVGRLTRTLAQTGFLRYHDSNATYSVWTGALRASHALLAGHPLRAWARPGMRALATDLQACVSLALLDGDEALTLDAVQGGVLETACPDVGMAQPAIESATGWALLALLPDAEREARMLRVAVQAAAQGSSRWRRCGAAARAGVQSCRREGYCADLAPASAHLRTAGVPLARTADGVCFALACSIEDFRLRPGQLHDEIGPRLLALARSIRAAISGAPSP